MKSCYSVLIKHRIPVRPLSVPRIEAISFIFKLETRDTKGVKRAQSEPNGEEEKKEAEIKRIKLDQEYSDEMKCGICIELMYQAVTVMPCLHNVCG